LPPSTPFSGRQDPKFDAAGAAAFEAITKPRARLDTANLVGALNEQIRERNAGNSFYRSGRLEEAMGCYTRARAILDMIKATSRDDEREVDVNRVAVLGNLAAVHMARAEYGAAAGLCTEALALEESNVKLLLRRARARAHRADWAGAEADMRRVKDIEPWSQEAEELAEEVRRMRVQQAKEDAKFAARSIR
jgi:tetratricopeptide (TPR) repeat protein